MHWNVFSDVATQGTSLIETNTVPVSNFTITQGTMTINLRWPDSANDATICDRIAA